MQLHLLPPFFPLYRLTMQNLHVPFLSGKKIFPWTFMIYTCHWTFNNKNGQSIIHRNVQKSNTIFKRRTTWMYTYFIHWMIMIKWNLEKKTAILKYLIKVANIYTRQLRFTYFCMNLIPILNSMDEWLLNVQWQVLINIQDESKIMWCEI